MFILAYYSKLLNQFTEINNKLF